MEELPIQIFYLDESCDECDPWVRETRLSPWHRVREIKAKFNDRVIIKGVEYVVEKDGTRRKLLRTEKHYWKKWDIPALGHIPEPFVVGHEPIKATSLNRLQAHPRSK